MILTDSRKIHNPIDTLISLRMRVDNFALSEIMEYTEEISS